MLAPSDLRPRLRALSDSVTRRSSSQLVQKGKLAFQAAFQRELTVSAQRSRMTEDYATAARTRGMQLVLNGTSCCHLSLQTEACDAPIAAQQSANRGPYAGR